MFTAARDITERKQAERQILDLALHDSLTRLPNCVLVRERLDQTMAASKRSGRYSVLIFLDLDEFKPLNDVHGHSVGDLLLIEVASRLSRCVREVDIVARFGRDEFVVILCELEVEKTRSTTEAGFVSEKICALLGRLYVLKFNQDADVETTIEYHCTSSIGVVLFVNHEAGPEEIIKKAVTAMYQAKESGGNAIRFFGAWKSNTQNYIKCVPLDQV